MSGDVETVLSARARLGEGPAWDAEAGVLWWVDVLNHRLHRFDAATGEDEWWDTGEPIGCAVPAGGGHVALALRGEVVLLDPADGSLAPLAPVEVAGEGGRLNDGKADARGRLWVGTTSRDEGRAGLWRVGADGAAERVLSDLSVSNGPAWSPDGRTMYLADSPTGEIRAWDFDAETGDLSGARVFVRGDAGLPGLPDGMAVDEEGCLWSARWDGGCVVRLSPGGEEVGRVDLPVRRVTSCAFGGADLRDLYVTTASVGLDEAALESQPQAGDLFRVRVWVPGVPVGRFGGG